MNPGELRSRLDRYLALRRALGFEMRAEERLLRSFVAFVEARDESALLRARVALDWACSTAERCGPGGQARRLSIARGFLTHLHAAVPQVEVPGQGLLARAVRPKPHIYSEAEIAALIEAARRLGPRDSLRSHTVETLIGLIVSSGLRPGEAMRLHLTDVDLDSDPPLLRILQTKFRKSRLVPIHTTATRALRAYAEKRRLLGYDGLCEHFFISESTGPLNYHVTARTFVAMARRLSIRGPIGERGASLHDLRHTFAVRRLTTWYREGVDVHARLPELSVYLGHTMPEQTYWYLTATPELLRTAADRFENHGNAGGER